MQLATVGPASGAARAQLIFALLILILLPPVLISQPRPVHGLIFEFGPLPDRLGPGMTAERAGWVKPYYRSTARWRADARSDFILEPLPRLTGHRHRLDLLASGELRFDSRTIEPEELRARLDWLMTRTSGWIDFRPDPEARHEDVVEILLLAAASRFDRLRVDNSRFEEAFRRASIVDPWPRGEGR